MLRMCVSVCVCVCARACVCIYPRTCVRERDVADVFKTNASHAHNRKLEAERE